MENQYYENGGPVYLLLGNKRLQNARMMKQGYWQSHGKEKKAMLFYISHRYYDFYQPVE